MTSQLKPAAVSVPVEVIVKLVPAESALTRRAPTKAVVGVINIIEESVTAVVETTTEVPANAATLPAEDEPAAITVA